MRIDHSFILYMRLVKENRNQVPLFIFCTFINGFALFLIFSSIGVLLTQIVSMATNYVSHGSLVNIVIYLVSIFLFALLAGFSMVGFTQIEEHTRSRLRYKMIHSYLMAEEKAAEAYPPTEILNRVNRDLSESVKLIGNEISGQIFQPMLSGFFSLVLLIYINWLIAFLCLFCTCINMLVLHFASDRLQKLSSQVAENQSNIICFLQECVKGASEVRTFRLTQLFKFNLKSRLKNTATTIIALQHLESLRRAIMVFFADCVTVIAILTLGAFLDMRGYLPFADIMLALPLSDQIGQMMSTFSHFGAMIRQGSPYMQRVFDIVDLPNEYTSSEKTVKVEVNNSLRLTDQAVCFDHVYFSYNDHLILDNVSFKVKPGEKIAFVGESGCGKSTILKLLLGLYMPNSGEISAGGKVLGNCSLAEWRRNFAYMPQEISLFHLQIDENISLKIDAAEEAIQAAAKLAKADRFILNTPQGYQSLLGESTAGLSGGQLQRLALARCLYRSTPVILLDEPTSALDDGSERAIKETLEQFPANKTIIAVTHRLALTINFDRIYVIKRGQIVERGKHNELLLKGGAYATLWTHDKTH